MIRRLLSLTLIALPFLLQAQTQINPTTQVDWTKLTGSGVPTLTCTADQYGEQYTDIAASPNAQYVCGVGGWLNLISASSGSGTLSGQVPGFAVCASSATAATGPCPIDNSVTTAGTTTIHNALAVVDSSGQSGAIILRQGSGTATPAANTAIVSQDGSGNGTLSNNGGAFSPICSGASGVCGGIVVDGVTYARTNVGIQAAITAAPAGGAVFLPSGAYNLSSAITIIKTGLHIDCQPGAVLKNTGSLGAPITLSGIGESVTGCTLDNNAVNVAPYAVVLVSGATGFAIKGNTFINPGPAGEYTLRVQNSSQGEITGNTISDPTGGNLQGGIWVFSGVTNLSIHDNPYVSGPINVETNTTSQPDSGITVSHNVQSIFGASGSNANFCGTFQDNTGGQTAPITSFTVDGNVCTISNTTSLLTSYGGWSIANNTSNGVVSNNTLYTSGQYVTIAGLEIACTKCTFSGNSLYMPDSFTQPYSGIQIYSGGNTITGNNVYGWGNGYPARGLYVYPNSTSGNNADNNVIANNLLINLSASAGGLQAASIYINCNVSGGTSVGNEITGNILSSSAYEGIKLQNAGTCPAEASIDGNIISGATRGIDAQAATVSIGKNYFKGVAIPVNNGSSTIIPASLYSAQLLSLPSAPGLATDSAGNIISAASGPLAGISLAIANGADASLINSFQAGLTTDQNIITHYKNHAGYASWDEFIDYGDYPTNGAYRIQDRAFSSVDRLMFLPGGISQINSVGTNPVYINYPGAGGATAGSQGLFICDGTTNCDWWVDEYGMPHYLNTTLPTATAGTVSTYSTNNFGSVTGLSGASSVAITFANSGWTNAAFCPSLTTSTGIAAYPTSQSKTGVTVTFASSFTGTLYYGCGGN